MNTPTNGHNPTPEPPKRSYKSVPETHKALSDRKYREVLSHIEAVLLEISTDGIGVNTPDGKISPATLQRWAGNLRSALETLSKAH